MSSAPGPAVRVVCVDGPLRGAEASCPAGSELVTLYDAAGAAVGYRVGGLLSGFPGDLHAATWVGDPAPGG